MVYVIAEPCIDVMDRACVDECPVDCIYEGARSLYIHPDECVDCGACEPVCPVQAIFYSDDLPAQWAEYEGDNARFFSETLPGRAGPLGAPGGAAKMGPTLCGHPTSGRVSTTMTPTYAPTEHEPEESIMSIADRRAQTVWHGSLTEGSGALSVDSGAFGDLPVTWASRTRQPEGKTSPEELAAAAHSSCFSMALALTLGSHDLTATTLSVAATVSLEDIDGLPTIVSSAITVEADIRNVTSEQFQKIVEAAAKLCPISRLFAGAYITVDATLTEP